MWQGGSWSGRTSYWGTHRMIQENQMKWAGGRKTILIILQCNVLLGNIGCHLICTTNIHTPHVRQILRMCVICAWTISIYGGPNRGLGSALTHWVLDKGSLRVSCDAWCQGAGGGSFEPCGALDQARFGKILWMLDRIGILGIWCKPHCILQG